MALKARTMVANVMLFPLLHKMEVDGGGGGEGGGFGAEAGGAEVDGDEAGVEGEAGFGFGEVAFGTYQNDDFRNRAVGT